ncbi:hypothetical protein [Desulfobulbus sp.]|uniref:hypothetical protein n=1 Tax=Desulfobulbus sp. TaxID=895 RepID=UPI00286EEC46|nr:hypothetical protein [Desulfobulbus sp.]
MNNHLLIAAATLFALGGTAFGADRDNPQACPQTLQTNCARCHGLQQVCAKLDQPDANWKAIVATMGQRGNLGQEVQEAVVACLTKTGDPKKFTCDK